MRRATVKKKKKNKEDLGLVPYVVLKVKITLLSKDIKLSKTVLKSDALLNLNDEFY